MASLVPRSNLPVVLLTLTALGAVGCHDVEEPKFRLSMTSMVSNEIDKDYQQEIADVLGALFGTPDEPYAHPATGLNQIRLEQAAGPAWTDQVGVNRGLYRRHCVHCHGVSGNGRGPTAAFLNPYPRDYRKGIFKFKSTNLNAKPTDDDLHRVLVNGVPGTSMPSFSLLPSSELESLAEYVRYLALRGEVETMLSQYVASEVLGEEEAVDEAGNPQVDRDGNPVMAQDHIDPVNNADQREAVMDTVSEVAESWQDLEDQVIRPAEKEIPADDRSAEEIAASIKIGRDLFYGTTANCFTCHGPTGLGDGQQDDQNIWNKDNKQFLAATEQLAKTIARRERDGAPKEETPEARKKRLDRLQKNREQLAKRRAVAATLLPVRNAIPRNLRAGIYRGGRRRIDVFWKIHAGIPGTPMPGLGGTKMTEAEIWSIVDYVLNLPYEAPSKPQRVLPLNDQPLAAGG